MSSHIKSLGGTDQAQTAEPPTDRLKDHHQECSLYWLRSGVNILQNSLINIGEKFSQNVRDWGRVCQLGEIYFVSRIDWGKSFQKLSGKSYNEIRKIFTPG